MNERAMAAPRQYETTIDRAGLALGAGSVLGGVLVLGLFVAGGEDDPLRLTVAWMIGSIFIGLGITAVAGPLWLVLHVAGLRRARHAAMLGAATAMAIFVGAQTWGFGLLGMPAMDSSTMVMRWIVAFATSAMVALFAAFIGVVMWRIAYRRQR